MSGKVFRSPAAPCLFWAGISVAGAVTAIAKFRVPDVDRLSLLRVGRKQFRALRGLEWAAAAAAAVTAAVGPKNVRPAVILAVAATGVQSFVTAPILEAKIDAAEKVVASDNADVAVPSPNSKAAPNAHSVHSLLEVVKLFACVVAAGLSM
jgi:hypothetical protein